MRRISLFTIALLTLAGCGGGGAAIEAPQSSNPETTNPPTTPSNPGTPSSAVVTTAGTSFSPATITVTPGSVVTWRISGATHNVTFGAAKPTGGDIPDIAAGGQADRSFGTAGTYDYQCTRHSGMTGRVVVTADGIRTTSSAIDSVGRNRRSGNSVCVLARARRDKCRSHGNVAIQRGGGRNRFRRR
jgi:plastocyanin